MVSRSSTSAQPPSRAPRVPSAEARQRILAAANELLRHHRYRQLSVEALMAASGLTRTVFYRHFRGLPHVVLGVLDELVASIEATPVTVGLRGPDLLRRQLEMVVATYADHGPVLLALEQAAREDEQVEAALRDWADRAVEVSVRLLRLGIEQGATPAMPVADVARALHAMNRAYLLELVASDRRIDRDAAVEALWTVWVRTTRIDPPERPATSIPR